MPDGNQQNGETHVERSQGSAPAPVNIQRNNVPQSPAAPPVAPPAPGQRILQPNAAHIQSTNAGKWTVSHSRLMGNMARNVEMSGNDWSRTAEHAVSGAESIVREFNTKGRIGWFSRYRRKKAFKNKMALTSVSRNLQDKSTSAPPQETPTLLLIRDMMDDDNDYLDYDDSRDFLSKYDKNYALLSRFAVFDATDLSDYLEANEGLLDEAGIHYTKEEIIKKAEKYVKVERFYRAKRDLIASPFYAVLTEDDTDKLSDGDLRMLSTDKNRVKNSILRDYLKQVAELRELKRDGIVRTGWADFSRSAYKKVSGKHGGTRGYFKVGNVSAGLKTRLKSGTSHGREYEAMDYDVELKHQELGKKIEAVSAKVEGAAEGSLLEAGFKGEKRQKYGKGNWEGNIKVGHIKSFGSVGGSLSIGSKDGAVSGWAGAESGVEVSAVKARVGASYSSHNDLHGVYANAEGNAIQAGAYAITKVGKFKIPDFSGRGEIEIDGGVAVIAGAQAGLVNGTVSGGFKIFGIKIGASLSGTLGGFGGSVGFYKAKGKTGFSLGIAALVGFRLDINIDFSYWTDKLKKKIVKSVRKR